MADLRTKFILTSIFNLGGLSTEAGNKSASDVDENKKEIASFLEDPNCCLLRATVQKNGEIILENHLEMNNNGGDDQKNDGSVTIIHFVKTRPESITQENLHDIIQVSSTCTEQSPISSLYHILQSVYAPTLLRNEKWSHRLSTKLQSAISELEDGLCNTLRQGTSSSNTRM